MYDAKNRQSNAMAAIYAKAARFSLEKIDRPSLAEPLGEALAAVDRLAAAAGAAPRSLDDGGPDYEDSAEWGLDDFVMLSEAFDSAGPTPLDVLAADEPLPPVAGGSPDASEEDWNDYERWLDEVYSGIDEPGPDRLTDEDVMIATGCCG